MVDWSGNFTNMPTKTVMAYTVLYAIVMGGVFAVSVDSTAFTWESKPDIGLASGDASHTLLENTVKDTIVLTVTAKLGSDTASVTYAITKPPQQDDFVMDVNTGVIKLKSALDFEITKSYIIEITATDTPGSSTATISVTLNIGNVGPVFKQSQQSVCAMKGSTAGVKIVTITADVEPSTDVRKAVYAFENHASDVFAINANSGDVTVNAGKTLIDGQSYNLTVVASVGNEKDTLKLKITVRECPSGVNEKPNFGKASETFCVKQGSSSGTYISTLTAIDPEKERVSYYLTGTGHTDFKISENGTLSVSSLSQEITKYELTVLASDTNGNGTMMLTIDVGDCSESGVSSPITAVGVFAPLLLLALCFN